jgi:predicted Rossmann-fold nucleotide-binding protein
VPCRIWTTRTNDFVTRAIQTNDLYERLRTLIDLGQAGYVVLSGATGTLLELSLAWELSTKGMLRDRPVVCVGAYWRPVAERIAAKSRSAASRLQFVESPSQLEQHFPPYDLNRPADRK